MAVLPAEFAELEPFAEWSLATERERYAKRLASTMDEMQAFYDAAFPRLADALVYLDRFDLAPLPEAATRLLWLCSPLVNPSFPLEWGRREPAPASGPDRTAGAGERAL